MKSTNRRTSLLALLMLTLLIGLPVWSVCRQVRRERLNRDLIVAIKKSDETTVLDLLNAGADANAQDKGDSPVSTRQMLLDWFDRLRGRKVTGSTFQPSALIVTQEISIWYGPILPENTVIVQALLERGADPNARDSNDQTALMLAASYRHTATARLLLDNGADVNARDSSGWTALMLAASPKPNGMIELLLDREANAHARTVDGETTLMFACARDCYRNGIERLLAAGVDVNARGYGGATALMNAALENSPHAVRLLLAHGAEVNWRDSDGDTALITAAQRGNTDVAKLLLGAGADVTVKDDDGYTTLTLAIQMGHRDIARLLQGRAAKKRQQRHG